MSMSELEHEEITRNKWSNLYEILDVDWVRHGRVVNHDESKIIYIIHYRTKKSR